MIARRPERQDRIPSLAARVVDSLNRADQMIQDLLDVSRIRAGNVIQVALNDCDLRGIAEDCVEELSSIHGDRFVIQGPSQMPGVWSCHDIRRALENLMINAVKYGDPHATVTISLHDLGEKVKELSVHNQGRPISPGDQARIFMPYIRTGEAEAGGKKGWGLGLLLVWGVTKAHGGSVGVRSSAAEGTHLHDDSAQKAQRSFRKSRLVRIALCRAGLASAEASQHGQ